MTDKLSLYNGALRLLGEERLASTTEDVAPRHVLDDEWTDGIVDYCLEQGLWNFALRTSKLTYSSSVTPSFGYRYAFEKPSDWIRTAGIWSDDYLNSPVVLYRDEIGYLWCDLDTLYVQYISNDTDYGLNYAGWPQTFVKYVEGQLAFNVCERITQNKSKLEQVDGMRKRRLVDARSKDALDQPAKFAPTGNWVAARGSGGFMRRGYDRG